MTSEHLPPELLAPAGDWECARAAVENGADAIFFGVEKFNARMRAENFKLEELPKLMEYLHSRGVKGYLTFNTLVFTEELAEAESFLREAIAAGIDAAIVQDIGICRLIREISPDFPIHASTQMTITSSAGVRFAKDLGIDLVVLARECSIAEIKKIQEDTQAANVSLPIEIFIHGALCVAYSGQCLTSESLGGRSANRGECAQACRLPYELISDGKKLEVDNGKKYLLSPQDLSGIKALDEVLELGITSLKIEGRLKSPEYVAATSRCYRKAIDTLYAIKDLKTRKEACKKIWDGARYELEMSFSRGLYTGWLKGINNQELVHAEYPKKRGVLLGTLERINHRDHTVEISLIDELALGDGVVFDSGDPQNKEEGGRICKITPSLRGLTKITLLRDSVNFSKLEVGQKIWKTSDPHLDIELRKTFEGENVRATSPVDIEVKGELGATLKVIFFDKRNNKSVEVQSNSKLIAATKGDGLSKDILSEKLGRFGGTPYHLGNAAVTIGKKLMLPISELNELRRSAVEKLLEERRHSVKWTIIPKKQSQRLQIESDINNDSPRLAVLARSVEQFESVLKEDVDEIICDFENIKKYASCVETVNEWNKTADKKVKLIIAPPRITKETENWIIEQALRSGAEHVLARNYNHLYAFSDKTIYGDFSLNVTNPYTAKALLEKTALTRVTASYDLTIDQIVSLLNGMPAGTIDVVLHLHMPMFHMEHCVFCAFMSEGTDYTNCGRPCEEHQVHLRDRAGNEHPLRADFGCRNTLFNSKAQTGAEFVDRLIEAGARTFRVELLNEDSQEATDLVRSYKKLLAGETTGASLWKEFNLTKELGVSRGQLVGIGKKYSHPY